jgi:hypothetical protein
MKKILLSLFILVFSLNSNAQLIEVNKTGVTESEYSLQQLVENVLISGDCSEVNTFESLQIGQPTEISTKSYGFFNRGNNTGFPFEKGIIITSGRAQHAGNIQVADILNNINNNPGDTDLETALGITNTFDTSFVKFNFKALNDKISFRFLMASEEYDGNTECNYADSFAFLIREVGTPNYINLAVLPDNTPVSTTNINNSEICAINVEFFEGYDLGDTNYGGRTKVLTAISTLVPGTTYEIKLVISDQGDREYDSAVFLEAGSFNLGIDLGEDLTIANNNAVCGTTKELDASIAADSYKWFKDGVIIPGAVNRVYEANLGNGLYKVDAILNASNCEPSGEVTLEFVTKPVANTPDNSNICEATNTGISQFNFDIDITPQVLDVQSTADFEILYFDSVAASIDNIAGTNIISPYTNTLREETIYVRIHNKNKTTCFALTEFNLSVSDIPIPTQPEPYRICDDLESGSDTDGIINTFLLNTRDSEVLGTLDTNQYDISYHTTQNGAEINDVSTVIPKDSNHSVTNSQTLFIRVENKDN